MAGRQAPVPDGRSRSAGALAAALVVVEVTGFLSLLAPIPVAWMWVGGKVFEATGSLGLDLLVAFGGFFVTILLLTRALGQVDAKWVELRRQAGHDQRDGALTRVVVVVMTFVMIGFWLWFHIFTNAFIIPFMPMN